MSARRKKSCHDSGRPLRLVDDRDGGDGPEETAEDWELSYVDLIESLLAEEFPAGNGAVPPVGRGKGASPNEANGCKILHQKHGKATARSLTTLGLISVLLMGAARNGGSETTWVAQAGEREELHGTEFPFPVGFVPEGKE